jgi:hypothetical protein
VAERQGVAFRKSGCVTAKVFERVVRSLTTAPGRSAFSSSRSSSSSDSSWSSSPENAVSAGEWSESSLAAERGVGEGRVAVLLAFLRQRA